MPPTGARAAWRSASRSWAATISATTCGLVNRLRDEVAAPKGLTVAQLALAWVVRNPVVTTAMVGARVPAEIEENVGAAQVQLSDDDAARIEALMSDVAGQGRRLPPVQLGHGGLELSPPL